MPIDPTYADAGEPLYGRVVIVAMLASAAAEGLVALLLVVRYGARDLAAAELPGRSRW
jgi:hypothetical protein